MGLNFKKLFTEDEDETLNGTEDGYYNISEE